MRIVLLNQFYPPDGAPTGHYLHDLARALTARGHEVRVIASRHGYSGGGEYAAGETLEGVHVVRLPGFAFGRRNHAGKLADYAAYSVRLAAELARGAKPDLILALTTPPFVGLLAAWTARARRTRHAHWVMDLYPDVMEAHDMIGGGWLRGLRQVARASLADAGAIVTLGPAMAARLGKYAGPQAPIEWIPLWAPVSLTPWPDPEPVQLRAQRNWPIDRLVLLYSGNFGLGHRFDEFLHAARKLGRNGPIWGFAGEGRARVQVERFVERHAGLPIELLSPVSEQGLREHLCSADVHLISMDSRWEGTLLPSKLQASFAVGKPVILISRATQDLARWVTDAGGGWVVPEGDVEALLDAIRAAGDRAEREQRGRNAYAYARAHFGHAENVARLVRACERAAGDGSIAASISAD